MRRRSQPDRRARQTLRDKAGKVQVGYAPPSGIQARYEIKGEGPDKVLKTMAGALDGFAKAATGAE